MASLYPCQYLAKASTWESAAAERIAVPPCAVSAPLRMRLTAWLITYATMDAWRFSASSLAASFVQSVFQTCCYSRFAVQLGAAALRGCLAPPLLNVLGIRLSTCRADGMDVCIGCLVIVRGGGRSPAPNPHLVAVTVVYLPATQWLLSFPACHGWLLTS